MTKEEKNLLLKDLCGRLPYKPHCRVFKLNEGIKENDDILYGVIGDNVVTLKSDKDECLMYYQIKPYLRPMSSMTEEEKKEWHATFDSVQDYVPEVDDYDDNWHEEPGIESYDYLISHHFDYRGLIEKGLALEAPEGMYNVK